MKNFGPKFFELSQDMLCILDFRGFIIEANSSWERILGWTPNEIVNKHFAEFIYPEDLEKAQKNAEQAIENGFSKNFEFRAKHKDGGFRWINWNAQVDQKDNVKYGIARDITDKKNAELSLIQREKEFADIFNNITEGVVVQNIDGKIIKHNQCTLNILDLTENQLLQIDQLDPYWAIVNEDLSILDPENHPTRIAVKTKKIQKNKILGLYRPSGELRWISVTAVPIFEKDHKEPQQVITTYNDISEQKQIKDQLAKTEYDLRRIFDGLPVMISQWDNQFRNIYANQLYTKYYNCKISEMKGMHVQELIGEEFFQKNIKYLTAVLNGQPQKFESEITLPDSSVKTIMTNYLPDFYKDHVIGFFVITIDITDAKLFEKSQRETEAKLISSAKMSSLGEMAGGIAHEINNPLSIIYGKSGQMKRRISDGQINQEKLTEDLTKIENMADRISKIIKGLHSFSRNSESDPMEKCKLSQIVEDTLELCKERFRNHSIDLQVNCNDNIFIECRATQISQVIMNFLSNAHDAVIDLPEKWVQLSVIDQGHSVLIKITDSGLGIPQNIIDKIMQPFFTTKDVGKGTGLGLSISKGLVESHGGNIEYDSKNPHTSFNIEIPKKQRHEEKKTA